MAAAGFYRLNDEGVDSNRRSALGSVDAALGAADHRHHLAILNLGQKFEKAMACKPRTDHRSGAQISLRRPARAKAARAPAAWPCRERAEFVALARSGALASQRAGPCASKTTVLWGGWRSGTPAALPSFHADPILDLQ